MSYETHFIGRVQLPGCLPDFCEVYVSAEQAADSICGVYDLSARQSRELMRDLCVDLDGEDNGHSGYAIIEECHCDEPWVHQEWETEESWKNSNGWEDEDEEPNE